MIHCPGVKTVSVVGLPDQHYGEVVAAFVVPREGTSIFSALDGDRNAIDLRKTPLTVNARDALPPISESKKRKREQTDQEGIANENKARRPRPERLDSGIDIPDHEDPKADATILTRQSNEGSLRKSASLSAELLRECVRVRLSKHLVPKFVFWIDELPMNPTGKIEKYKLQKRGCEALEG